jgi:NADH-quinone oxidoreductase subunit L
MRRMGGLKSKIPITYMTMLIGSLAIAGIPPLAGFFSKDEVLGEAFKFGFVWVWAVGLFVAFLTAFYMFRLMGMTFWGGFRGPKAIWDRIHESPPSMTVPLILLAIPSVLLGIALGLPLGDSILHQWLEPVFEEAQLILGLPHEEYALFGIDGWLILASVTVATIGMVAAWRYFGVEIGPINLLGWPELVREISARPGLSFLYRASLNKWWFDELNHLLFMVIGGRLAAAIWWFDREVVDGTVNAIGGATVGAGRGLRRVQTGRVQNYALGIALGLLVMAGSYLLLAGRTG